MRASHFLVVSIMLFLLVLGVSLFAQSQVQLSASLIPSAPFFRELASCSPSPSGSVNLSVSSSSPLMRVRAFNPYPFPLERDYPPLASFHVILCSSNSSQGVELFFLPVTRLPPGEFVWNVTLETFVQTPTLPGVNPLLFSPERAGGMLTLPAWACSGRREVRLVAFYPPRQRVFGPFLSQEEIASLCSANDTRVIERLSIS